MQSWVQKIIIFALIDFPLADKGWCQCCIVSNVVKGGSNSVVHVLQMTSDIVNCLVYRDSLSIVNASANVFCMEQVSFDVYCMIFRNWQEDYHQSIRRRLVSQFRKSDDELALRSLWLRNSSISVLYRRYETSAESQ